MLSVAAIKQLPATDLPEVAFVGRSNVGKSTLINALTNHKQLARTSNTPGRTQQINLFNLGEPPDPRRSARLRFRQGAEANRRDLAPPDSDLPEGPSNPPHRLPS